MSNTDIDDTLRKIFVGGLDYDSSENTVREYFESWGPLSECSVKRFPDGRSRGFAFVTFCSLAAMEQCIATGSHVIDGKSVDLRRAASGREENEEVLRSKEYDPEAKDLKKLFVGNLDFETVESSVEEYFSQYGDIDTISIGRAPDGKSRGYAFVNFVSASSVDRVQETRPHSLNDRKLETKRATPKHLVGKPEANVSTNKAFIGPPEVRGRGHSGLSEDISDDHLKGYFGQFGTVLSVQQMIWDDSGKKRGYGYVEFSDDDAVDKIVLVRTHIINGRELEAKKCLTKQQMKEMDNLNSGYGSSMSLSRGAESRGLKRPREAVDPEAKIMRKLFVGNLDLNVDEENLETYFGQFGEIENVTIHKFPDTGKSRGFGFVTFTSSAGVDNVQSNRPHEIAGQKLDTKRNLPKTDYGHEEARVTKIYIGAPEDEKNNGMYGLNENTSDEDLEQYFGQFGRVVKVDQLVWRDSGRKRGYGYIEFEDEDAVDKVVLIGIHTVKDVKLEACKAIDKNSGDGGGRGTKRSRREVDMESALMRKLFVRNLSSSITEDQLRELFGQFGDIETVQLPTHSDSGKPKGFAFITFRASSAVDTVQRCRPHRLDGYVLETSRATPKEDLGNPEVEARSKKIFIGGLDEDRRGGGHSGLTDDVSDADLEQYFSSFGTVTKVDQKIWEDTGKKRGYGYIEFDDEDAVDKIVLIGVHTIKGIRLLAKKGLNKEQIRRGPGDRGRGSSRGSRSRGGGYRERERERGDMQMMQDRIMNMQQNMAGPGAKKGGDKSMAMMSSMQQMMLNMMSMCNHMMGGQGGQGGQGGEEGREAGGGAGPSGWDSYQQSSRDGPSYSSGASRYSSGYSSAPGYGGYGTNSSFGDNSSNYSGGSHGYSGGYTSSGYGSDSSHSYGAGPSSGYSTSSGSNYTGTQGYSDYSSPSYSATWSTGGPGGSRPGGGGGGPVRSAARDPRTNPYSRN